eukprot:m.32684 g.32684  ORF g.32684 m.32684 type:complete len:156 (-) comp9801_c0_seq3:2078-2545(-)
MSSNDNINSSFVEERIEKFAALLENITPADQRKCILDISAVVCDEKSADVADVLLKYNVMGRIFVSLNDCRISEWKESQPSLLQALMAMLECMIELKHEDVLNTLMTLVMQGNSTSMQGFNIAFALSLLSQTDNDNCVKLWRGLHLPIWKWFNSV